MTFAGPHRVITTAQPLHVMEVRPRRHDPAAAPEETFLLIHGYGATSYMWRHWALPLSARGRVLLVDLKGFGSAPKPDDGRYTPADLTETLVALVAELDLRSLTLVGQSLGGGLALHAALGLGEEGEGRLERMVLLAAAAYLQRLPPFVALSRRPRLSSWLLGLVGAERVVRAAMRQIVHDPSTITEDQVRAYARALSTREGQRAAFAVGRDILPPDLDETAKRYESIDVPVLLLWGDRDPVIPLWVAKRLEADLPRARLEILEACGHLASEERPDASLRTLERFLDEHPPQ